MSDDSDAFKNAWYVVCSSYVSSGIFRVPHGQKFLLQPLTFNGTGSLHGQGQKWWQMGCIQNKVGFAILDSKNVHISGLTSVDSRKWHISIERSSFVHASKLNIKAPKDSPRTDDICIEHSTNVTIASSIIKIGDDCIGIGDGSKYININRIFLWYSIGSLGKNGRNETVEYVTGGHGYTRHIRFERLSFNRVIRPIIIDQYSCPSHQHCNNHSTAAEINNILYNDLRGTMNIEIAVVLSCSESSFMQKNPHERHTLRNKWFTSRSETTNDVPFPLHPLIMTAMDLTDPHIEAYLRDLKPHFVFYDFTCWFPALTRRLGSDLLEPPEGFPSSSIKLRAHEAQALAAVTTMDYGRGLSFVERQLMSSSDCDIIGFKTCREIEGPYGEYIGSQFGKPVIFAGLPFLVALKPPMGAKTIKSALPEGFQERLKEEGYFTEVGLMAGDLKIGVEVEKGDEDGVFTKYDVCKAIKTVMDQDNELGNEVRTNHAKWKEFLLKPGLENSYMDDFVMQLHALV
ncbi:hypothetical protein CXB51_022207 [Gossypium anomalum]|uniref:Uncharacterized protein n=1 Tax=Gossypium anomalum TaxID=47600 RepID=A0A8J5Z7I7_9ROSI|nr:hypothetical protein CXB51_022207 [Gossypium anomalum]